jgi:HEAT repeat protein
MSNTSFTGREPRLSTGFTGKGKRRLSLRRLGTMLNVLSPDAVSLDAVREMVKSDDFFVRYNAAKLLSKRADRDARVIIEDAMKMDGPRTRASLIRHVYNFSWFSAEPMLRSAMKDDDPRVREAAVYALAEISSQDAYDMLIETLKGEDDVVLEAAAVGLRNTQDPAAIPVLELVLNEAKDPDVRIKALEVFGMSGWTQTMAIVRQAMFDPEPTVKYAAALSLLELAGEGWLDELAGVIGRTTGETLEQVLLAFFHATNYLKIDVAKSKSADLMIDALETALLDESDKVRQAAVWPLAWLRHERTPQILLKTYRLELDSTTKAHIVRVATGLMSEAGDEILQDALKSDDELVREAAEKVQADRERAGGVARFDENADKGEALNRETMRGEL